MKKKIIGMVVCTLVLATCLPVTGTLDDDKKPSVGITPFWNPEHVVGIHIDKLYVYDSSDPNEDDPGEYFFKLFAIPQMWHWTTDIYEVDDETPDIPYHPDKLGSFKTKFTPQIIIILALEEDKAHDLNPNDFLDWKIIRFNPPKGDYPLSNQYFEIFQWENQFFHAVTKIYFYYQ